MENLNEQIKDPNQLDMFEGVLFTLEQEKMIADFINLSKKTVEEKEKFIKSVEVLLNIAGFVKDITYVNNFKIETVTREVILGSSWNKNQFTTELTYLTTSGNIFLKGTRFDGSKMKEALLNVDIFKGKFNCYTLQNSSRYIKLETLLEKLKHYNEREQHKFEEYKKKNSLKQNVIEKYTKLYPNTTITTEREYSKYSGSFDIIVVKFESGSYVQFRLDTYNNKEYLHSKFDAEFEVLNSDELLERFSKQVKKEGSN
jgi:DNA-binding XRE family transcriptional regulator